MRIAILYICTGRYAMFWKGFFETCERNFLREYEKNYFVFTDANIPYCEHQRVHRIEQAQLGWPYITLKRFHIFETIIDELREKSDFIIFFNANVEFLEEIGPDFLPTREQQLLFTQHPGYYNTHKLFFPYERRKNSTAYIPYTAGSAYIFGCENGGYTEPYIAMIQQLRKNVDADLSKGIVARWHDESHINHYMLTAKFKLNSPAFAYPDKRNLPFPRKIRVIDKAGVGGHDLLRGVSPNQHKSLYERFVFRPCFPQIPSGHPVIVARLLGGLGNQMFIFAAAFAAAKRMGAELALDTGALQSDRLRSYELHHFGLMNPQWRVPKYCNVLLAKWLQLKRALGKNSDNWRFVQSPYTYDSTIVKDTGNYYLNGYWQSPKYFADCADTIRQLFTRPIVHEQHLQQLLAYIQAKPTVAVHLRRGDYTLPKNITRYGILPLEYYDRARKWLEKSGETYQYLVFSDSLADAQKFFSHWGNTQFCSSNSHVEDLMLMSLCAHAIIANSSFSWWGAWLGEKTGQKVVAPQQWFGGAELPFAVADLFPDHWVRL